MSILSLLPDQGGGSLPPPSGTGETDRSAPSSGLTRTGDVRRPALGLLLAILVYEGLRGWRAYRFMIFLPYILPVPVIAVVFSQLLQQNGALNEILSKLGPQMLAPNWLGDPKVSLWAMMGVIVMACSRSAARVRAHEASSGTSGGLPRSTTARPPHARLARQGLIRGTTRRPDQGKHSTPAQPRERLAVLQTAPAPALKSVGHRAWVRELGWQVLGSNQRRLSRRFYRPRTIGA